MKRVLALALFLSATAAHAQPTSGSATPADPTKSDAKALLGSGLKLFAAKDYLGALAVFKDAYERFPSSKILLNIGTTEKALGRNADAANTYQRYLDASDADPAKKDDVQKVIAELDAKVGTIELTVTPDDAEVQVGTADWMPARDAAHYRVEPGSVVVHARKDGYESADVSIVTVTAGSHKPMTLTLKKVETPVAAVGGPAVATTSPSTDTGIDTGITPEPPPGKLGFFAYEHVDVKFKGAATFVGGAYEVIPHLQAEVGAVLGPNFGGYVGARYSILPGKIRPVVAVGAPLFFSDGARISVRGAGGVEVTLQRHVSLALELGVEHVFNPEMNIAATTFIPALGAVVRL